MRCQTHRRSTQSGFTLLEIMIVVVIIGVLATGALLSLGAIGKDSGLQQERDRLSALIAYGRERGAMLTLEYGIRCGQHGYRFVYYDNRLMRWAPETVDETLRPRRLPTGVQLELTIEGHQIVLDDRSLQINPVTTPPPGGTVSLLGSSGGNVSAITGSGGLNGALGSAGSSSGTYGSSGSSVSSSGSIGPSGSLGSSGGGSFGSSSSGGSGISGLNTGTDNNTPQVMLFSNGDTNTFILTMERPTANRSVTLQSSDDGTVKVGEIVEGQNGQKDQNGQKSGST
jgi:type II secretion system protein H